MGWLVTSQSFLFAAWAALIKQDTPSTKDQFLLASIIPIVGSITAFTGGVAVAAAINVTDHLITERTRYDVRLGIHDLGPLRDGKWTRWAGQLPTEYFPQCS